MRMACREQRTLMVASRRRSWVLPALLAGVTAVAGPALAQLASSDPYQQALQSPPARFEQPAPRRIAELGGAKLDTLQWIGPTILAAAAFQKNKLGLSQGPLTIYDVEQGAALIEIPRSSGADRTRVTRSGEVLLASVVDGRNDPGYHLTAFTLAPAEVLWRKRLPTATRLLATPLHDLAVTVERRKKKAAVVARDLRNGKEAWRIRLSPESFTEAMTDQLLVADGDRVSLYSVDDGERLWSAKTSMDPSTIRGTITFGDRIGVYSPDRLTLFERATGAILGQRKPGEGRLFTAIYSHPVTMVAATSKKTSRRRARSAVDGLLGLDRDGRLQWDLNLEAATETALFLGARSFSYVSGGVATLRELDTGKRLATRELPAVLRQRINEGVLLRVTELDVDVLSPYGRYRFDLAGRNPSFTPLAYPRETIAGRAPVAFGSADNHRAMASALSADMDLVALVDTLAQPDDPTLDATTVLNGLRVGYIGDGANVPGSGTEARRRELDRTLEEYRESAREARRSPNAIAQEGRELANAYDELSIATLETEIAATEARHAFERNAALADFASSAANVVEVFLAGLEAAADRAARLEQGIVASQTSDSVKAGYLLSTPARAGCSIDIVRLADDAVARVQWRPLACTTQNCSPNSALPFPRSSISPGGNYLVFEGPGLAREQFSPPHRVRDLSFPAMGLHVIELSGLDYEPTGTTTRGSTLLECRGG